MNRKRKVTFFRKPKSKSERNIYRKERKHYLLETVGFRLSEKSTTRTGRQREDHRATTGHAKFGLVLKLICLNNAYFMPLFFFSCVDNLDMK